MEAVANATPLDGAVALCGGWWWRPGVALGLFEYTARSLDFFQKQLVHFGDFLYIYNLYIYLFFSGVFRYSDLRSRPDAGP